jgi:hypothetical protein
MKRFNVIRAHIGDRDYGIGDTREANEAEVSHLIGTCLEPVDDASKNAGGAPENKALKGAPKNKAAEPEDPEA